MKCILIVVLMLFSIHVECIGQKIPIQKLFFLSNEGLDSSYTYLSARGWSYVKVDDESWVDKKIVYSYNPSTMSIAQAFYEISFVDGTGEKRADGNICYQYNDKSFHNDFV